MPVLSTPGAWADEASEFAQSSDGRAHARIAEFVPHPSRPHLTQPAPLTSDISFIKPRLLPATPKDGSPRAA